MPLGCGLYKMPFLGQFKNRYLTQINGVFRNPGIMGCLHPQPKSSAIPKILAELSGNIRRNRLLCMKNIIELLTRDIERSGDFRLALPYRLHQVIE